NQSRGNSSHIHGGHHDRNTFVAFTLQTIKHREKVSIQPEIIFVFENHVTIVDKDNRRSILLSRLEYTLNLTVEIARARDESSINEEELTAQAMCKGASYCCLAGSRRSSKQYASFRTNPQLGTQSIILQWNDHVGFQRFDHVIKTFQGSQ